MILILSGERILQAQQPAATKPAVSNATSFPATMTFRLEAGEPNIVRARVDGTVKQILSQSGATVTANSPLVEIDGQRLLIQRELLKAAFLKSHASYREAAQSGDQLIAAVADARKQADASSFDILTYDLEQYTSRSPIDGIVSAINVRPGQFVTRGTTLVEVLDSNQLRVDIPLPSNAARVGTKVAIIMDGRLVDGVVLSVNALAIQQKPASRLSDTYNTVTLTVENSGQLKPGQIVIPAQRPYAIVPTKAITSAADGNSILKVMRGTQVVEIPAVVLTSLKAGEQIVMADLQPNDLACIPGPVASVPLTEPLLDFGAADPTRASSVDSLTRLGSPLPARFPPAETQVATSETTTSAAVTSPDINIQESLRGLLLPAQLPLMNLNLTPVFAKLNLSASTQLAIEQLKTEFQAKLNEQQLGIQELADLKGIDSADAFQKRMSSIRLLNQEYAELLVMEIPEATAVEFKTFLQENLGLKQFSNDTALSQFETAQFDIIKKRLASEMTAAQAQEAVSGLLQK